MERDVVETTGRPSAGGDRLYGRGAYDVGAGPAVALVVCRDADRLDDGPRAREHSRPGPGTLHAPLIAGGREESTVPDLCVLPAEPAVASCWTDSAFLSAAGIPSVLLGPLRNGSHAEGERVRPEGAVECARALVATAKGFRR